MPTILVNVTFAIEMQAKHIVKVRLVASVSLVHTELHENFQVIQKMKRHKDSRVEPMPGTEEV